MCTLLSPRICVNVSVVVLSCELQQTFYTTLQYMNTGFSNFMKKKIITTFETHKSRFISSEMCPIFLDFVYVTNTHLYLLANVQNS